MDLRTAISYVLVFIVFVISIGIGATIITNVRSTTCGTLVNSTGGTDAPAIYCSNDAAMSNITYTSQTSGLSGMDNISDWSPTIGTIMGASIVLTILVGAFAFALTRK